MATDLSTSIADYLKLIHDDFVWKTLRPPVGRGRAAKPPKSSKLVYYQRLLIRSYLNAVGLFEPVRLPSKGCGGDCKGNCNGCQTNSDCRQDELCIDGRCAKPPVLRSLSDELGQPCKTTFECQQDELCVGGICVPAPPQALEEILKPCRTVFECQQDELCIDGLCTPAPYTLMFRSGGNQSEDMETIHRGIEAYFGRIHRTLVSGLNRNPAQIAAARDLLMRMYAEASTGASIPDNQRPTACTTSDKCKEDFECVNGMCVPSPFELGFKALGFSKPW